MSLLEDHHRKLAGLIKEAPRKDKKLGTSTSQTSDGNVKSHSSKDNASKNGSSAGTTATSTSSRRRLPQSSIASNLAEKRGIPTAKRTTEGTAVNVAGAIGKRTEAGATPVRDLLAQQSRRADLTTSRELQSKSKEIAPPAKTSSPPPEDNFRRFYSAFGGVISAISAPLAFTSLPLNPTPPTPVESPKQEKAARSKPRTRSPEASRSVKSSIPDIAALISKPALRALREDGSAPLGPNESFYLVPGTASYASHFRDKRDAPLASIDEGSGSLKGSSHEEFVDARETVGPPSPTKARRPPSHGTPGTGVTSQRTIAAGRGQGLKTLEELSLENETLKTLVDKQAKRIQMWELNSQNQFNALAQSFRARGPPSRLSSDPNGLVHALSQGSGAVPALPSPPIPSSQPTSPGLTSHHAQASHSPSIDATTAKKIADLEAMLASQTAKVNDLMNNNDRLAKQNEKNNQIIGRYRDQWEKLKAGARKKESERRERRVAEVKAGETAKDSESGDATGEGEDIEVEEPGFGKA